VIECMICHAQFTMVSNSHIKKHGLTCEEYKRMFPGVVLAKQTWLDEWRNSDVNKRHCREQAIIMLNDDEIQKRRRVGLNEMWQDSLYRERHAKAMKVALSVESYRQKIKNRVVTHRMRMSNFDKWVADFGHDEAIKRQADWMSKNVLPTKSKNTKIELMVQTMLDELRVEYKTQFPVLHYLCDVYVQSLNLIIEVNGNYWHANPSIFKSDDIIGHKKTLAKELWHNDERRVNELIEMGYKVLVLWESDIKKMNSTQLKTLIDERIT